jgi:hypothetical protein
LLTAVMQVPESCEYASPSIGVKKLLVPTRFEGKKVEAVMVG